jgi:hypothetical protein
MRARSVAQTTQTKTFYVASSLRRAVRLESEGALFPKEGFSTLVEGGGLYGRYGRREGEQDV